MRNIFSPPVYAMMVLPVSPSDGRWGVFPAFSAGWILTKEAFLADSKWLSSLKLRASYGHNRRPGNWRFPISGLLGTLQILRQAGLRPQNLGILRTLPGKEIKWLIIGLDFEMYNGRISGSVELFPGKQNQVARRSRVAPAFGILFIDHQCRKYRQYRS